MTKQTINIGTTGNDGSGDKLRVAFDKVNHNFDELYVSVDSMGAIGVQELNDKVNTVYDLTNSAYTVANNIMEPNIGPVYDTANAAFNAANNAVFTLGTYTVTDGVLSANGSAVLSANNSGYASIQASSGPNDNNGYAELYWYTSNNTTQPNYGLYSDLYLENYGMYLDQGSYDANSVYHNYEWHWNIFDGSTSFPGRISMGQTGYLGPDLSDKTGEKITLWDQGAWNYAIGIEADAMWFSVDEGLSSKGFVWYTGNNKIMDLTREGTLTTYGDLSVTAHMLDHTGSSGISGQVLTSIGTQIEWKDANTLNTFTDITVSNSVVVGLTTIANGVFTFPSGGTLTEDGPLSMTLTVPYQFAFRTAGGTEQWTFTNTGVLGLAGGIQFPDTTIQTTAYDPVVFGVANAAFDAANAVPVYFDSNVASYLQGATDKVISGGNITLSGNLIINGTTDYFAGNNAVYTDSLIEIHAPGGNVTNVWTSNDARDIGIRMHYYNGGDKNAALVLANDTKYLEWYIDGSEVNGVFVSTTYGDIKANAFHGNVIGSINGVDAANLVSLQILQSNLVSLGASVNAYSNVIGSSANAYSRTFANTVGTSVNAYTVLVGTAANTYAASVGASGNAYAVSVGTSGNAYTVSVGASVNAYTVVVGTSSNNYAGVMANSANAYAASLTPNLAPSFNAANQAGVIANASYNQANTNATTLASSYTVANAAFAAANSASGGSYLPLSGGTLTGALTVKDVRDTIYDLGTFSAGGSLTVDATNGDVQTVILANNVTINGLTNPVAGQTLTLIITQDGTGGRLLSSTMKFAGGNKTLSTGTNAIDMLTISYLGGTYYASLITGFA